MRLRPEDEAALIIRELEARLPTRVDGRAAIGQMRDEGSTQWRQMEWIGFWFEHFFTTVIGSVVDARPGPAFGRTRFDLQRDHVWDLKAHPHGSRPTPLILNDREAVDRCIEQFDGVGYVIVHGVAEYDESGEFKAWHDTLKGGVSAYEEARVSRGARSRRRKVTFSPVRVDALYFSTRDDLQAGQREGWVAMFQEGMRNSDGAPRRAKYLLHPDRVPTERIVATCDIG